MADGDGGEDIAAALQNGTANGDGFRADLQPADHSAEMQAGDDGAVCHPQGGG